MDASELRTAIEGMVGEDTDLPLIPFPTPEWPKLDGHVFVRGMAAEEGDEREIFLANHSVDGKVIPGTPYISARTAVLGLVDKDGQRIFTGEPEHLAVLSKRNGALVDRAYFKILKLSGIGKKAAEALEKN